MDRCLRISSFPLFNHSTKILTPCSIADVVSDFSNSLTISSSKASFASFAVIFAKATSLFALSIILTVYLSTFRPTNILIFSTSAIASHILKNPLVLKYPTRISKNCVLLCNILLNLPYKSLSGSFVKNVKSLCTVFSPLQVFSVLYI